MNISLKRFAAFAAAVCVALSPNVYAAEKNWYDAVVNAWKSGGIVQGYSNGNINANAEITRAEFFALVNRAMGFSYDYEENIFSDVSNDKWYYNDILTAYYAGYLKGVENNGDIYAMPDSFITREDAITILYRCFSIDKIAENYSPNFTDYNEVSEYAKEAVNAFAYLEYLSGYEDGSIRPKDNITRAQMMTLFSKISGKVDKKLSDIFGSGNLTLTQSSKLDRSIESNVYIIVGNDIEITNLNADENVILKNISEDDITVKLNNCNIGRFIVDESVNGGDITILAHDGSVSQCYLYQSAYITSEKSDFGKLYIVKDNCEHTLNGNFDEINVDESSNIEVSEKSSINTINVNKASSIYINEGSKVNSLNVAENANDSTIVNESSTKDNNDNKKPAQQKPDNTTSTTNNNTSADDDDDRSKKNYKDIEIPIIKGAYMAEGKLYILKGDYSSIEQEDIEVKRYINSSGEEKTETFTSVKPSNNTTKEGFDEYYLYSGDEKILFGDGKYSVVYDGAEYPVVSVLNYRVTDKTKLTQNKDDELNGKTIPFNDNVYAILFNADYYDDISIDIEATEQSLDSEQWPEILKTGIRESNKSDAIIDMYNSLNENRNYEQSYNEDKDVDNTEDTENTEDIENTDNTENIVDNDGNNGEENTEIEDTENTNNDGKSDDVIDESSENSNNNEQEAFDESESTPNEEYIKNESSNLEQAALNSYIYDSDYYFYNYDIRDLERDIEVAYPKKANSEQPAVYYDEIPQGPSDELSLDHMDKMTITICGKPSYEFYWDAISKIWYKENTSADKIDMVYVEGGEYKRGDWRGKRYAYLYDNENNINIKKLWLNCLDPQFMGETEEGENAVGVTGLLLENSNSNDEKSDMWLINDDATSTHDVKVDDFEIGKYEVTMEQFYRFVDDVQGDAPKELYYTVDGNKYYLNDVASYSVYNKRTYRRDNGWGFGSRPAIDINWYEAIEFCNWLSLNEGLETCYTFTNIYNGAEGDGLTPVLFMDDKPNSIMGKNPVISYDIQLCSVDCDFTKNGYRLPTEAEFEYAARGGKYIADMSDGKGYLFPGVLATDSTDNVDYYSWQRKNVDNPQINGESGGDLYKNNMGANGYSNPVGTRLPNILGIHDMSGNVWETTWDFYSFSYYKSVADEGGVADNPKGPEYTIEQKSILDNYPVDPYMSGKYKYTYRKDPSDGSSTRTAYQDITNAGKFAHTLRGGCFTNPYILANTLNRYSPGQVFVNNCINFTDARVGFRIARTATEDTVIQEKYDFNMAKNTVVKAFEYFQSAETMDLDKVSNLYDLDDLVIKYPSLNITSEQQFLKWAGSIPKYEVNKYVFNSMDIKYLGENIYSVELDFTKLIKNTNTNKITSKENYKCDIELTYYEGSDYMKINRQIAIKK